MSEHGGDNTTTPGQWTAGEQPWVRRTAPAGFTASVHNGGGVTCYFCGKDTAKVAAGDVGADSGRVRLYCDNGNCDAREVTILVERDGAGASRRADVRALRAVDNPDLIGDIRVNNGGLITRKPRPTGGSDVLPRRLSTDPLDIVSP